MALAKVGVIRLSPDVVHFIIPGNEGRDGVQVWSYVAICGEELTLPGKLKWYARYQGLSDIVARPL